MILRKVSFDNSVKYVSTDRNSQNDNLPKDNKPKTASLFKKKQNKIFEKTIKISLKS